MSGYTFVDGWTRQRGQALMQSLSQGAVAEAVEIFLTMWTDGPTRSPEQVDPAVREDIRTMAAHNFSLGRPPADFRELDPPAVGRLKEIQAPTLIVLGDKDTSDIHAIGQLLRDQVAGAEVVMIPDVGHTLVMEKPAEFNQVLDQFLRR
jgi:pimeloyl-ACP methyl ester carboxylesterase